MLLGKIALGFAGTLALAGAYTFHEGILRVSVDEHRAGGTHVHLYLPAAVVPLAVHVAPRHTIDQALHEARPMLPAFRVLIRGLKHYPDADFVEVKDADQQVQIRTHEDKLQIDVDSPQETVHLSCPLAALEDLASALEERRLED